MKTFIIKRGRHYSCGPKWQPLAYSAILMLLSPLILIASTHLFYVIIGAIALFATTASLERKSKTEVACSVMFDSGCIYELDRNIGQVNKLMGRSEGFHHNQSARFGWRCVGDKIELMAYCYINGARVEKKLDIVSVDEWVDIKLSISDDYYRFTVTRNDKLKIIVLYIDKKNIGIPWYIKFCRLFTYRLYPYFGGMVSAPHQMKIQIKDTAR